MERCEFLLICLILVSYIVSVRSQTTGANVCGWYIPCDNSQQCIGREDWCNGITNCQDESDEKYCQIKAHWWSLVDNDCNGEQHFVCDNRKCIPKVLKCDGYNDCSDGSDEFYCESEEDRKSVESSENGSFNEVENNHNEEVTTVEYHSSLFISSASMSPFKPMRPRVQTVSTVSYYDHRRAEGSIQPNVYPQYGQPSPHYNSGSDTIAGFDFFRTTQPTYATVTRTPRTPSTTTGNPIPSIFSTQQRWPILYRPRVVIHHPPARFQPVSNNFKNRRTVPLPPFHFESDNDYLFGNQYSHDAQQWLIGQRDSSFSWGKDTPRALVALSLISNTFPSSLTENELMRKRLKIDLGIKLIRRRQKPLSINRLAMYINALIATCQDPMNTFDQNLVEMLHNKVQNERRADMSPFAYITLCLTNSTFTEEDFAFLENTIKASITDEITKDKFILATSALACLKKAYPDYYLLGQIVDEAFHKLQQQQLDDGSFGSIYSTAIAAQALIAIDSRSWNPGSTINYLSNKQLPDGSFGDMLATYYTMPVLSGRSLVHLRNTQCELPIDGPTPPVIDDWWNVPGPKKTILYSLATDYRQSSSIGLELTVPVDRNFFDIMQMAQHFDPRFKFLYTEHIQKFDVYTINNIPNDPERGTYWNLYVLDRTNVTVDTSQRYKNDIRTLIPQDSQELLFWYLPFKPY